jgi:hypothetical protein
MERSSNLVAQQPNPTWRNSIFPCAVRCDEGGMDDEGYDVPNLEHDDNEPDLDIFGASQLYSAPMPQSQTHEALGE